MKFLYKTHCSDVKNTKKAIRLTIKYTVLTRMVKKFELDLIFAKCGHAKVLHENVQAELKYCAAVLSFALKLCACLCMRRAVP